MRSSYLTLLTSACVTSAYVWPSPKLEELDHFRWDQTGFNAQDFAEGGLTRFGDPPSAPCDLFFGDITGKAGRSNAADWIRTVRCTCSSC